MGSPFIFFIFTRSPVAIFCLIYVNIMLIFRIMIRTFADVETERFFNTGKSRKFPSDIIKRAVKRLTQLEAATILDDLRMPPSNRLEALTGNRTGQWSIRINDQWRVCFRSKNGEAFDVEIVDYH